MAGFHEALDLKVLRTPMKKRNGGGETFTPELMRSMYPKMTTSWLNNNFIFMADFKGNGKVTTDEFSHFIECSWEMNLITNYVENLNFNTSFNTFFLPYRF